MGRQRRKKGDPVSGWVALDKPLEITSTDAVSRIRRLYNAQKAGHAGTLDPLASGILPIALGEATKTVPFLMEADKTYRFTIRWGVSTASQDGEGEVIATSDARPTPDAAREALARFVGEIDQVPPKYSAIKIDGERAYDVMREGGDVALEARKVIVHSASLDDATDPDRFSFTVRSGKGFYIRALARDLAAALGCEGYVDTLRRTAVGPFTEDMSIGLESLEQIGDKADLKAVLRPVETALDDIPALAIDGSSAFDLRQGRTIVLLPHLVEDWRAKRKPRTIGGQDASRVALATSGGQAIALGEIRAGKFQPTRVFQLS